jgi:hypothetical protein
MTTIIFDTYDNALRFCKYHDVSTQYIKNSDGCWMLKYPGVHKRYEGNCID